MNRFIGIIITVVAIAALAGAAIGWRFPFTGRNQSANRLQTAQQPATVQSANRRTLRTTQPNRTAQALNNNQTNAQAPNATTSPDVTTPPPPSDTNENQPIPALW